MATNEEKYTSAEKEFKEYSDIARQKINEMFRERIPSSDIKDIEKYVKEAKQKAIAEIEYRKKVNKIFEETISARQKELDNLKKNLKIKPKDTSSDIDKLYKAQRLTGGIETLFSGNFSSGVKQIASAFPQIAKIMGGPYYLAIQTVISGLLKLDDALSKSTKTVASLTGGIYSQQIGGIENRFTSVGRNADWKSGLYNIGMQGSYNDIVSYIAQNMAYGTYKYRQGDIISSMGYAQKSLGSFGVSPDVANALVSNLATIERKDETGIQAQLSRITKRFDSMSYLSPAQALQQATSLYDQTKHLGVNFEWASRQVTKFERELKLGTMAVSDFAALNKGLKSGSISQNAGIGALISDYALRRGISLPGQFASSNALGQGFALRTAAMSGNKNILRAYEGSIGEIVNQMVGYGGTRYDRAGALQTVLQGFGIQASDDAVLKAIGRGGEINLSAAGLVGKSEAEKREDEIKRAEQFQDETEKYYKNADTYYTQVVTHLGNIFNELARGNADPLLSDLKNVSTVAGALSLNPIEIYKFNKMLYNNVTHLINPTKII